MVTQAILLGGVRGSLRRASSVTGRNVSALRSMYWLVLLSGFAEPVLYLLSLGVGVGALVGDIPLPDGRSVPYATFVAPAMLAASAMTGAFAETTFNFFGKLKYMKLYDAILATPVKPFEIALGELAWAMLRGTLYSAAFLILMIAMGLTSAGWALAALPATILAGFTFGALGMALSSYLRDWQDFDYLFTAQFALFLLSGTFAPVSAFPPAVQVLIQATPLYHAVELIRGLSTGSPQWALLWHAGYLAVLCAASLLVASRRMARILYR